MSSKFIDAHEAARWVASGDTVCTVGMTLIGAAESILSAIEARFLTAGEPRDLTLLHAAGQSDRQRGIQHFAHPGMVTRLIGSHWGGAALDGDDQQQRSGSTVPAAGADRSSL